MLPEGEVEFLNIKSRQWFAMPSQHRSSHLKVAEWESSLQTFKETVHFYMIDFETPLGRGIDLFIIFLNLMASALFVINTYPISAALRDILWKVELAVIGLFIIEYLLRFYGAEDRWCYVKDIYSIIDLVAIFPTLILLALPAAGTFVDIRFIQTIRVFAVFRIFRFLRFFTRGHMLFGIISLEMINVARLILTILMLFFISSGLFYYVESPLNPKVRDFGDAFYFTVVAISTVGFGDIVPVSGAGRLVAMAMIITGIILIPLQASRIVKEWVDMGMAKARVACPECGLSRHDLDALYCKNCGHLLPKEGEDKRTNGTGESES
jgi:voltage-gated potassium channel